MVRDFSIREEIKIELHENLPEEAERLLDVDDIYNSVECDELMLNVITLSIYETIQEKLKEKDKDIKEVENIISMMKRDIVELLYCRGYIIITRNTNISIECNLRDDE